MFDRFIRSLTEGDTILANALCDGYRALRESADDVGIQDFEDWITLGNNKYRMKLHDGVAELVYRASGCYIYWDCDDFDITYQLFRHARDKMKQKLSTGDHPIPKSDLGLAMHILAVEYDKILQPENLRNTAYDLLKYSIDVRRYDAVPQCLFNAIMPYYDRYIYIHGEHPLWYLVNMAKECIDRTPSDLQDIYRYSLENTVEAIEYALGDQWKDIKAGDVNQDMLLNILKAAMHLGDAETAINFAAHTIGDPAIDPILDAIEDDPLSFTRINKSFPSGLVVIQWYARVRINQFN